jgi:hypothetical protein
MRVLYSHSQLPAASDGDDGGDLYEVDYIMDHRAVDGGYEYRIKWKGYDERKATWEPQSNINDPQPVERYYTLLSMKSQAKRTAAAVYALRCGGVVERDGLSPSLSSKCGSGVSGAMLWLQHRPITRVCSVWCFTCCANVQEQQEGVAITQVVPHPNWRVGANVGQTCSMLPQVGHI